MKFKGIEIDNRIMLAIAHASQWYSLDPLADALPSDDFLALVADRSGHEALGAAGGFQILNDFTARNVQMEKMQSGFRPQ